MSNPRESVYTGKQILDVLDATTEYSGTSTSSTGRTARAKFRSYLLEATSNSTLSPFVYKDILRALIVSFGNLHFIDGENQLTRVKSVHGNPERTIAKLSQEDNIILPIITIHQDGVKEDKSKRRFDDMIIQRSEWNQDIQRAERIISSADVPVKLIYNVNLWCKYMEDLDQLSQSLRLRFNPSVLLKTPISNAIKAFLVSETSKSSASAGDREDRVLRKSFALEVEAYIPSPQFKITSTGRIEKIVSDLWISKK